MDGGDCTESGTWGEDCGKPHCHNNTITFHPLPIVNKRYVSCMLEDIRYK